MESWLTIFNLIVPFVFRIVGKVKYFPNRTHAPSTTRRSEGPCQHRIFPLPLARRTLNGSSISLSGNLHPQQTLMGSPLCTWEIGLRNFANPVVKRWSLESPKPETVNADLSSFLFGIFPIAISAVAMSSNLSPTIPESRFSEILIHSQSFDLSTPLYSIGTSDFAISRILMQMNSGTSLHETLKRSMEFDSVSIVCHLSTR
jgi:hypothetical protein